MLAGWQRDGAQQAVRDVDRGRSAVDGGLPAWIGHLAQHQYAVRGGSRLDDESLRLIRHDGDLIRCMTVGVVATACWDRRDVLPWSRLGASRHAAEQRIRGQ